MNEMQRIIEINTCQMLRNFRRYWIFAAILPTLLFIVIITFIIFYTSGSKGSQGFLLSLLLFCNHRYSVPEGA